MLRVAIARNGRERLFKVFPCWNDDAEKLMDMINERNVPATANFVTEYQVQHIAHTNQYPMHGADGGWGVVRVSNVANTVTIGASLR